MVDIPRVDDISVNSRYSMAIISEVVDKVGLGIDCNFMIDNQLQQTDRLSIIISSSHFFSNWVLEV